MYISSRNHKRITNEAKALRIVFEKTQIPVPKLLCHGSLPDGRRYLVTELIKGVLLDEFPLRDCSKPGEQRHIAEESPCAKCPEEAYSNATNFIKDTVLPQLSNLKSQARGIDGFVMPPSWLNPDIQPPWKGKTTWEFVPIQTNAYIFQHGDLAAHNIFMDPQSLQPIALIDWEFAGFYPVGMERWSGSLKLDRKRSCGLADPIAKFLPDNYLQCHDRWENKAKLDVLVEQGELSNPHRLRFNKK